MNRAIRLFPLHAVMTWTRSILPLLLCNLIIWSSNLILNNLRHQIFHVYAINYYYFYYYMGADKSLARPGRKQATATEDFDVGISYL